jgi:hypothetical protein
MKLCLAIVVLAVAAIPGCKDAPPPEKLKPAPKITGLLPTEVTDLGFRLGSVEGEGFDTKRRVKVYFDATPAGRAAVVAKTKIQVEVPPAPVGTEATVRVEIEGYEPAVAPMKMKYISHEQHEEADGDSGASDVESDAVGSAGSAPTGSATHP